MTYTERNQPEPDPGIESNALLLSSLLDQLPFPVWVYDESLQLIHGAGCPGWLAPAVTDRFDPLRSLVALGEVLRVNLAACLGNGRGAMHQGWVEIENVGNCYLQIHFLPVPGNLIACIPMDMTAAKQVEELLFSSESKYRTLVEAMRDGVWVHNSDLVITFCNDGLSRMLGISRSELLGKRMTELVPDVDEVELARLIEQNSDVGCPPLELQLSAADGTLLDVSVSSTSIANPTSSAADYFAVVTDISDQRRVLAALHESERRYRAVAEDQQELICRFDEQGRLTFANQAYQRFTGRAEHDVMGGFFIQTLPEDEVATIDDFITRILSSEGHCTIEHRVIGNDGGSRWLHWTARVVSSADCDCREIQAVGRDITERKVFYREILKYQEQLRTMTSELIHAEDRERRRIAAGLDEDLGRILTGLASQLEQAGAGGELDRRTVAGWLDQLNQAIKSCTSLTFELSPPVHHGEGFISSLEWLVDEVADRHGIKTEFSDDLKPKPLANNVRVQLYQTIRGILFTLAQHGNIDALRLSIKRKGSDVRAALSWDTAGRDSPAVLSLDSGGLFTIRERIGQVGGRIETKGGSGGITWLGIYVPAGSPAVADRGLRDRPNTVVNVPERDSAETIKVLLIDSQVMMREGLRSLLLRDPRVEIVGETGNGQDALDLACQLQPDLILLDSAMTGSHGADILARIKPVLPDVRVIATSRGYNRETVGEMISSGAESFILKDNAPQDLFPAIEATLAGERYLSQDILESVLADFTHFSTAMESVKPSVLTNRELEVLGLLSDGLSTKEIARQLNLSVKTVETHRRRISAKLNITSIAELTKYAIREGVRDLADNR